MLIPTAISLRSVKIRRANHAGLGRLNDEPEVYTLPEPQVLTLMPYPETGSQVTYFSARNHSEVIAIFVDLNGKISARLHESNIVHGRVEITVDASVQYSHVVTETRTPIEIEYVDGNIDQFYVNNLASYEGDSAQPIAVDLGTNTRVAIRLITRRDHDYIGNFEVVDVQTSTPRAVKAVRIGTRPVVMPPLMAAVMVDSLAVLGTASMPRFLGMERTLTAEAGQWFEVEWKWDDKATESRKTLALCQLNDEWLVHCCRESRGQVRDVIVDGKSATLVKERFVQVGYNLNTERYMAGLVGVATMYEITLRIPEEELHRECFSGYAMIDDGHHQYDYTNTQGESYEIEIKDGLLIEIRPVGSPDDYRLQRYDFCPVKDAGIFEFVVIHTSGLQFLSVK